MATGNIELTGDVELTAKLDRINYALKHSKKLMGLIGNHMKLQTLQRTIRGVDAEGNAFSPYSKPYAKKRKAAGLPIGKVDLFWTGSMSASLTYIPHDGVVRLYFMDTSDKFGMRNPQKAYFIQTHKTKPRNFFSISMKDVVAIEKMVKSYINKHLKKMVRSGSK